ncbi:PDZ domain-containing protein [Flagellimonas myxillae]|uniref:PDZ domain-containing protein n=1 Tax=Flagellimonas myxillae TaxID=2942214 RepID=UPI00201ED515|nr:PDZ domain-containing protein [Muricauda myxillae]MCL6267108.1 PDZ domain-containing protein [Muricauda myxillae]
MKIFGVFCAALLIMGCHPTAVQIHVNPTGEFEKGKGNEEQVRTIEEALGKLQTLRNEGNANLITIYLAEGEYRLDKPLELDPNSGPLKIIGATSQNSVLKGSQVLDLKWENLDENIWKAQIDVDLDFDQLFINGKPQILARYPNYDENGGHWQGHASDAISKERVGTWKSPEGTIVHAMHSGEWGGFHYVASGVDEKGELELQGGHQNNRPSPMHPTYRMVENVFEELDSPGEWYLDKNGVLYYWPAEGIDLSTAKVEGVHQKSLLRIVGTEDKQARNISVENLHFTHTRRTLMEEYEPLLRSDWTIFRGGALFLEGTSNISIKNCEFSDLGGNAIFVSNFNRNVTIRDSHIHECGASAISFVGSPSAVYSPSFQYKEYVPIDKMDTIRGPRSNLYPSNCIVDNNLIHRIGRIEKQTAGVEIAMAMNIVVSNNSIYDVPRAGINIGDGTWGGHLIEHNDVFNTVLESGDHGAFNSWGRDRFWHPNRKVMDEIVAKNPNMPKWDAIHTTIIRNNRFRCDHGWDIDLDDGSSNYQIYNNLCLNGGIKLREGFYRKVANNIMLNNGFHPHVWFKNSGDVFKHNIVFTEHKDIRLDGWGKEIDYNFFPDQESLNISQGKGVDIHSIHGTPQFASPETGNFNVATQSEAVKIGFKPFETNSFGVKAEKLKAIAKVPEFPVIFFGSDVDKSILVNWLGSKIKNIESMAERSASGLNKTAGVLITSLDENGILARSDIQVGDVIITSEDEDINTISDLMKSYQTHNWKGKMHLEIFRNQTKQKITITTKK